MGQVTLSIGGMNYNVACRDGEEAHLQNLGKRVDSAVIQAVGAVGSASEVRGLLFASLLLADALQEAEKGSPPANVPQAIENIDVSGIDALATRLEQLASTLENRGRAA
jgi:cell division protein ZapA